MPPNRFESEVESFLEGSHGDRTHNKQRADHHTVTPLCGTLLADSAKVFAQRGQNGPKWAFCSLPGEFFRGCGREGCLLGEFYRALRHCGKA